LKDAYKRIIDAIKIETESQFVKLANIVEIAVALVEAAKKLQIKSSNLVKAINTQANKEVIMKAAQEAKLATDEFLKYANLAADNINDLVFFSFSRTCFVFHYSHILSFSFHCSRCCSGTS
jgi:hypothetical protein